MTQTVHDPNYSGPKLFMTQTVHDPNCLWPKLFMTQTVHDPNCSRPKLFMTQTVHDTNCSWHKLFMTQTVHDQNCTWPKLYMTDDTNIGSCMNNKNQSSLDLLPGCVGNLFVNYINFCKKSRRPVLREDKILRQPFNQSKPPLTCCVINDHLSWYKKCLWTCGTWHQISSNVSRLPSPSKRNFI